MGNLFNKDQNCITIEDENITLRH